MKIRRFSSLDKNKVSYLIRRCLNKINSKDYTAEQIAFLCKEFTPSKVFQRFKDRDSFVATQENKILGCITLKSSEIGSLFVNPSYTRQGVGSYLYSYVENLAMRRGLTELYVNSSKTAVVFYKNKGYVLKNKNLHAFGGNTYIMCKKLKKHNFD